MPVTSTLDSTLLVPEPGRLAARRTVRRRRSTEDAFGPLMQGIEAHQHRYAGLLHDEVLQDLYGLRLITARADGAGLEAHLDLLADRVRRLTDHLRPPSLHAYGLAEALRTQVEAGESGLHVRLHVRGVPAQPRPADAFLLRIVQEALANVARHAGTTRATLTLQQRGRALTLCLSDTGAGFDVPRTFRRFAATGRFGLLRAQAYARAARGRLTVVSAPGAGTVLTVRVPTFGGPHV